MEAFDCVFHVGGINFFTDKVRAIKEMIWVAKPGTKIVIVDETERTIRENYQRTPGVQEKFWAGNRKSTMPRRSRSRRDERHFREGDLRREAVLPYVSEAVAWIVQKWNYRPSASDGSAERSGRCELTGHKAGPRCSGNHSGVVG